jgi:hypothetical protein
MTLAHWVGYFLASDDGQRLRGLVTEFRTHGHLMAERWTVAEFVGTVSHLVAEGSIHVVRGQYFASLDHARELIEGRAA